MNKEQKFWNWFKEHNSKFMFLNEVSEEEKEKLLDEFLYNLHMYNENLFFEIGGHPDNSEIELIISAEGNSNYFDQVEKLVKSGPKLKDWVIIALKPAMNSNFTTKYNSIEFDPKKTIFIPLNNKNFPDKIGIHVCYSDYNSENKDTYLYGTHLMLDVLLGEKSAALDIDYIDVKKTPQNISDYLFFHLDYIKEFIAKKKNTLET